MRFSATDEKVKVWGRSLVEGDVRYLGFSGSRIMFTFTGKSAKACIWSDSEIWPEELKGRLAVYVNDEKEPSKRICLDGQEKEYVLYESETEQTVTLTLMKYSEAPFGKCGIQWIEIDSDELNDTVVTNNRKMEIIGDSITCGYGVEAESELIPFHTATENPTKSYSLLTASALDCEVNLVSWSGNGLTSHYVEENATEPRSEFLMPLVYQYTDIATSACLYGEKNPDKWEKWDFAAFQPDIVLINLGTNDCSWCKDIAERKETFKMTYLSFLEAVREGNPKAPILCMLGTMDTRLLEEIDAAVKAFNEKHNTNNVYFLSLPPQNPEDGLGADFHPCAYTHRKTAELVAAKVKEIMGW